MVEDEYGKYLLRRLLLRLHRKGRAHRRRNIILPPPAATMSDRAYGFRGFAAYCNYLIVADTIASRFYRFDTTAVIFT